MKTYVIFAALLIMSFVGSSLLAKPLSHMYKAQDSMDTLTYKSTPPVPAKTIIEDNNENWLIIPLGFILSLVLPGIVRVTTSALRIWHVKSPLLPLFTDIPPPFSRQ